MRRRQAAVLNSTTYVPLSFGPWPQPSHQSSRDRSRSFKMMLFRAQDEK
jgi:hypothetical protein